jgi:segregation and condensation protein B
MDELKAAGFLDAVPPSSFSVPNPTDALAPDEDPYEGEEEHDFPPEMEELPTEE